MIYVVALAALGPLFLAVTLLLRERPVGSCATTTRDTVMAAFAIARCALSDRTSVPRLTASDLLRSVLSEMNALQRIAQQLEIRAEREGAPATLRPGLHVSGGLCMVLRVCPDVLAAALLVAPRSVGERQLVRLETRVLELVTLGGLSGEHPRS